MLCTTLFPLFSFTFLVTFFPPFLVIVLHYTFSHPFRNFQWDVHNEALRERGRCGYCCQLSNACLNKPPGGCANKDYSKHLSSSLSKHTHTMYSSTRYEASVYLLRSCFLDLFGIYSDLWMYKLNSSVIPLH